MATILAIHAHPDDIEHLCAGTLAILAAQGHAIRIVTATALKWRVRIYALLRYSDPTPAARQVRMAELVVLGLGLLAVVSLAPRRQVAAAVAAYITAAYWFTSSTSFANPAVAIARSVTNTFSGIRPADLPGFIAAEFCGALVAMIVMGWLLRGADGAVVTTKEASP